MAERLQAVASVDETAAPTGNSDSANPEHKRNWQWVMVTPRADSKNNKLIMWWRVGGSKTEVLRQMMIECGHGSACVDSRIGREDREDSSKGC